MTIGKGFVTQTAFKKHLDGDWRTVHELWSHIRNYMTSYPAPAATTYTKTEIDAFFEGYSGGKAQVDAGNVVGLTQGSIPFADASGFLTEDNPSLFFDDAGNNLGLGTTSFGANMVLGMQIKTGTAPTGNVADTFAFYSADFAAGNACPYFRTENGTVIGLNQGLLTTDTPTFGGIIIANGGTIGQAAGPLMTFDDTGNTLLIAACNVGIGITPSQKLHVYAASGDVKCRVESVANNTAAKFQLIGHSADNSVMEFGDEDLDNVGAVQYSHGADSFRFTTANALGMTLEADHDLAVVGCVTDGTCEIMKDENALAIIKEILNTGTDKFDKYGHEKWDMKKIHEKYPFLIHKGKYKKTLNDDLPEVDRYYDRLGAKGDLAYAAILQLEEKIKKLEDQLNN